MAEQAPSLSEITNFAVDPERGTGTPAVVFQGGQEMVRNLNESAKFQAQNDMDKYKLFLGNLKDAYARGDAIAATEVAPQDREAIQKRLADVMGKIGQNPKGYFRGGADATKLTEELQKVQIDANKSKQDHIYDLAHRDFLERNPTLQTDENNKKISDFSSQSLEERKPFILESAPIVDIGKLKDDILGSDGVSVSGIGARPYGTDGHYNQEYETKTVKFAPFMQKWNLAPELHPEIGKYVDNLYNKLPAEQRKNLTKAQFWDGLGQRSFGQNGDYYNESKGKLVKNDFALDAQKSAENLKELRLKLAPVWAKIGIDGKVADAKIKQWESKTKGTEQVKNDSMKFATALYGQLKDLADANGVITPDKIRQLTSEQLKYLGTYGETSETNPATGKTISKKGLVPLTLGDNEVLQLDNGKIGVLRNAKYEVGVNGHTGHYVSYGGGKNKGGWDNTRTTTLTNIATNRVNEENQLSGGKETNNYLDVDSFGTEGGVGTGNSTENTSSGSSSSTPEFNQSGAPPPPSYTEEQLKSAGWTDEQIQKEVEAKTIELK